MALHISVLIDRLILYLQTILILRLQYTPQV